MTIQELIDRLSDFPPDMEVLLPVTYCDPSNDYETVLKPLFDVDEDFVFPYGDAYDYTENFITGFISPDQALSVVVLKAD